ncbi:MAG TPA: DUF2062 domain-containing protein [Terriglobales bacterium]|nr:DUF2062 domain-containing protein [Terriglobales bacterium]
MGLLLKERLDPSHAAAAVFVGIFVGIVPIYGFQTLAAIGLALVFKLNKPLTVACTFINNPLLLPPTIFLSVELGCFLRTGAFLPLSVSGLAAMRGHITKQEFLIWLIGSVALAILAGGVGAAVTAFLVRHHRKSSANAALRERVRYVNRMFTQSRRSDREFVRWKLRLDRIFELLAAENLGSGTVVDLGCGYGMALCFAVFGDQQRRLVGCDLDQHRIAVARGALASLNAEVSVADVRDFELPPAGLILIMDVLQCLSAAEQLALLKRCCSALAANGILMFRVHDRERGVRSGITMAFERMIFACRYRAMHPEILALPDYRRVLESAGMQIEERRFNNRLPLAHILIVARKRVSAASL